MKVGQHAKGRVEPTKGASGLAMPTVLSITCPVELEMRVSHLLSYAVCSVGSSARSGNCVRAQLRQTRI